MKNKIRSIAAGLAVGAVALTGAGLAGTGEAAARVDGGRYTMHTTQLGAFHERSVASVRGGVITARNSSGTVRARIVSTRTGGYYDLGVTRLVLDRKARGVYAGPIYTAGIRTGEVKLVPRR